MALVYVGDALRSTERAIEKVVRGKVEESQCVLRLK
jgi:hypothetical protein